VSLPLAYGPEVKQDLASGFSWYETEQEGLGYEFVDEVLACLDRIRLFPKASTEIRPGVRRTTLHRFPYNIVYKVSESEITIIAVIHGSRHPSRWKKRLRN
jgi:plasmid stabilization system protein ParE